MYVLSRMYMANHMPIMDCDEVYNYWEPLSFLLHGTGQQTWEYANEYALRTYAYIVPLQVWTNLVLKRLLLLPLLSSSSTPLSSLSWKFFTDFTVSSPSVALFVLLRASLAAAMAGAELFWLSSLPRLFPLKRQDAVYGQENYRALLIVGCTGLILLLSPGMNHAAAAYLPSSTWMLTWLVCSALFLRQRHYAFCIVAIAATLCVGWPFGVATVVPMAIRILCKEYNHQTTPTSSSIGRVVRLLSFSAVASIAIQLAVVLLDNQYYQRWTSATYNIFAYNAAGGGDELYGVEPASYYIKNLLLNLTLVAPLAMPALPLLILSRIYKSKSTTTTSEKQEQEHEKQEQRLLNDKEEEEKETSNWWDLVSILSSFYLWLLILVPRPHKEERFLFPIYPVLCLAAIMTCDTLQLMAKRMLERYVSLQRARSAADRSSTSQELSTGAVRILAIRPILIVAAAHCVVYPIILLSTARSTALCRYYMAPLHIYATLAASASSTALPSSSTSTTTTPRVCTCGEWYRFPSSFFLTSNNLQLGYLPSSFGGQLPQDFSMHGSGPQSRNVLQPFNDQNKHEPERYVSHYQQDCLWIVDLQDENDDNDNDTSSNREDLCQSLTRGNDSAFELVESVPFLDASRTVSSLHRVLYIPFFHKRAVEKGQVSYQRYVLYKRRTKNDDFLLQ
jgi:alpha-1,2-mannosyltransferase